MINEQANFDTLLPTSLVGLWVRFLLILLIGIAPLISFSQECKINSLNEESGKLYLPSVTDFGGSTFMACQTGLLTTLTFKVTDSSSVQQAAKLFLEKGIGNGASNNEMMADYVQSIAIPGNGAVVSIDLTTPFAVEKDIVYTWYIQKDPRAERLIQAIGLEPNNIYQKGQTWYNNEVYPTYDNLFTVTIETY